MNHNTPTPPTNYIPNLFNCLSQAVTLPLVFLLTSCSIISEYDSYAYQQAVLLKVESLALMQFANDPFTNHQKEIIQLEKALQFNYEYAKGRPNNQISEKQWAILTDKNRNLLGGFLERRKSEHKLNPFFIIESQKIISDAFDTIIGLESGKIAPTEFK